MERPLVGRRVVVTRPRAQADDLVAALQSFGAEAIVFPTIRIAPPEDSAPLRHAAAEIAFYDWVIFTSVNGVARFWAALEEAGHDSRALGGVRVACIGPATAMAVELHGVRPDLLPATYVAEALLAAFVEGGVDLDGTRFLLPRAAGSRDVLLAGLAAHGASVEEVEAYRAVADVEGADDLRRRLHTGEIDALTFTSSSTVRHFAAAVGREIGDVVVAAIGPITAETAHAEGLPVHVVASEYTIPGLARALAKHYSGKP